jgi:hypothetical protein
MEPNVSDELGSSIFRVEEKFFFCLLHDDTALSQATSIDAVSNFVCLFVCLFLHVYVIVLLLRPAAWGAELSRT